MLNAMLNVIIAEKLYDQQYVQTYTEDFDKLAESVKPFTPEEMSPIWWYRAGRAVQRRAHVCPRRACHHLLGHGGIAAHPRHRQRPLPDRTVADLRPGRTSRHWLHPLRGQNNVQGASDAGLIPMFFPDYKSVENSGDPGQVRGGLGVTLDPKRGKTVVEIMEAVHHDEIKGMYIMGENPAMSDPDLNLHARGARPSRASCGAGHLPDRDRVLRRRHPAGLAWLEKDGTVTNTNRQVQMGRAALPLPGDARISDHPGPRPAHRL